MEEILASIRRIISEDDGAQPAPTPQQFGSHHEEEVLELTDKIEQPHASEPAAKPTDTVGDLDIFTRPEPAKAEPSRPEPPRPELGRFEAAAAPALRPEPVPAPRPETRGPAFEPIPPRYGAGDDGLVSEHAAEKAAAHFGQLAQSIAMPASGVTLDDVVRDLLRPLLRDWLDQNLTAIVEAKVQAEVERIARQRR